MRGLRLSPPHPRLVGLGAVFGEKGGWERPNWFASNEPNAAGATLHNPGTAAHETGARAAADWAGLFDFTSFSKFEIEGRAALGALQWLPMTRSTDPWAA